MEQTRRYRIFTDDRGPGLYSALFDVMAHDRIEAVSRVEDRSHPFWLNEGRDTHYQAIEWPPTSRESLTFLNECVQQREVT